MAASLRQLNQIYWKEVVHLLVGKLNSRFFRCWMIAAQTASGNWMFLWKTE